jgi:hypothetical protein
MLQSRPALSYSLNLKPILLLICDKQVPEYTALNSFMEDLCKGYLWSSFGGVHNKRALTCRAKERTWILLWMLWPSEIRVTGMSDEGEQALQIPLAKHKGWQSNHPFCYAIPAASEGAFNISLWSKFALRKIKRGGINLPLAFTHTTNVTLRPLFHDVSLPPTFCLLQKAFCC